MTAKELKATILQLAVTGKLVPQDPNDEPASEFLKRISLAAKNAKGAKGGRVTSRAENAAAGDGRPLAAPFEIPETWQWVRLGDVAWKITDGTHKTPRYVSSGIEFVSAKDISNGHLSFATCKYITEEEHHILYRRCNPEFDDILISKSGSIGMVVRVPEHGEFSLFESLALVKYDKKAINPGYLQLALQVVCDHVAQHRRIGIAVKHLHLNVISNLVLPLPPLAEQERIVAKVEALLPLVEEYGRLEEARRQMDADLPAALERSILQEAIRGRLLPQDPNDEPASELVKRIRAERARTSSAAKAGRAARSRAAAPDRAEDFCRGDRENVENDIALPKSWQWVRLGEVSNYGQCKSIEVASLPPDTWSLDLEEIEKGTGRLLERKTVAEKKSKSSKHVFTKGMVLYSKLRTYLNKVLVADRDGVCTSEIVPIELAGGIDAEYVRLVLMSPYFLGRTDSKGYGIKMPRVGTEDMRQSLIPIPPLAEQRRIVAKVEELRSAIRPLAT